MDQSNIAADGTGSLSEEGRRPIERYLIEFTATVGEYFRIWIVNLGLTIATLGIYSAWAKVRKRRYLYSHTRVGGEGFEYYAKPLPILKGRLIAVGLLVAVIAAGRFVPAFVAHPWLRDLTFVVVLAIAGPWLIVQSLKFNAYNTAYRNIRLRFDATYTQCIKIVAVYGWLLLLPFLYPYFKRRLVQFAAENHYYGTTRFTVLDFKRPFIRAYAFAYGFVILMIFLLVPSTEIAFRIFKVSQDEAVRWASVAIGGIYAFAGLIFVYIRARTINAVWNNIRIGVVRFESLLRVRDLLWLYVGNLAAIVLTVGLAIPWAVIRTHRYRASKTTVIASGPLDSFVQTEAQQISATGDEVGEMFDIDIAL